MNAVSQLHWCGYRRRDGTVWSLTQLTERTWAADFHSSADISWIGPHSVHLNVDLSAHPVRKPHPSGERRCTEGKSGGDQQPIPGTPARHVRRVEALGHHPA